MSEKDIIEYLKKKYGSYERDRFNWYDFPSQLERKFSYLHRDTWYYNNQSADLYQDRLMLRLL